MKIDKEKVETMLLKPSDITEAWNKNIFTNIALSDKVNILLEMGIFKVTKQLPDFYNVLKHYYNELKSLSVSNEKAIEEFDKFMVMIDSMHASDEDLHDYSKNSKHTQKQVKTASTDSIKLLLRGKVNILIAFKSTVELVEDAKVLNDAGEKYNRCLNETVENLKHKLF